MPSIASQSASTPTAAKDKTAPALQHAPPPPRRTTTATEENASSTAVDPPSPSFCVRDTTRQGGVALTGIRVIAYNLPAPSSSSTSMLTEPEPRPSWEVRLAALRHRRSSASFDCSTLHDGTSTADDRDTEDGVVRCSGEVVPRPRRAVRSIDFSASPFSSVLSSPTSSGGDDSVVGSYSTHRDFALVTPSTSFCKAVADGTRESASPPVPLAPRAQGTTDTTPLGSPSPPPGSVTSTAASASSRQSATAAAANGPPQLLSSNTERPPVAIAAAAAAAAAATARPTLRRLASTISAASTATFAEAPIAERSFGHFFLRDSPPSRPIRAAPMQTDSDSCDDEGEEEECGRVVYASERVRVDWYVETPSAGSCASETAEGSSRAVNAAAAASGVSIPDLAERFLEHIVGLQKSCAASTPPPPSIVSLAPSTSAGKTVPFAVISSSPQREQAATVAAGGRQRRYPSEKAASHCAGSRPKTHSAYPQLEPEDANSLSNSAPTTATLSSLSYPDVDERMDRFTAQTQAPPKDVGEQADETSTSTLPPTLIDATGVCSRFANGQHPAATPGPIAAPRVQTGETDVPLREAYPAKPRTTAAVLLTSAPSPSPTHFNGGAPSTSSSHLRTQQANPPPSGAKRGETGQQSGATPAVGSRAVNGAPTTTPPPPRQLPSPAAKAPLPASKSRNGKGDISDTPSAGTTHSSARKAAAANGAKPPFSSPTPGPAAQKPKPTQRVSTVQPSSTTTTTTTTTNAAAPSSTTAMRKNAEASVGEGRGAADLVSLQPPPLTGFTKPLGVPEPVDSSTRVVPSQQQQQQQQRQEYRSVVAPSPSDVKPSLPRPRLTQKPAAAVRPLLSHLVAKAMTDYIAAHETCSVSSTTAASSTTDPTVSTRQLRPAVTSPTAAVVQPTPSVSAVRTSPAPPAGPRPRAPSPGSSPEAKPSSPATRSSLAFEAPKPSRPQQSHFVETNPPDWRESLIAGVRLHRDSPHTRRPRLSSRERSPSGRVVAVWSTTSPGAWDGLMRSASAEREASLMADMSVSSSGPAAWRRPGGPGGGGDRSAAAPMRAAPPNRPLLSTALYPAFHSTMVGAGYRLTDPSPPSASSRVSDDVQMIREELELQAHLHKLKAESMQRRAERYF